MDAKKQETKPGMMRAETSPVSPLGPSPPRKTSRLSSTASPLSITKQKSGEYLFNKRASSTINLNDFAVELEYTQSPVSRKVVREGRILCPPRDTSRQYNEAKAKAASEFYTWAMRLQGDNNRFEIVTTLNSDFI
jgi:hypothetical protein